MSNAMMDWLRSHTVSCVILSVVRILIGAKFLMASLSKLGNPAWTGDHAGAALSSFVQKALLLAQGPHTEVSGWYAWFLENLALPYATFFSYLVPWGELLTGIALIVGCFTNFSALMGVVMNLAYLLAGVSSANPLMLVGGMIILFAGHNAARLGLDYWVSPFCTRICQEGTLKRLNPFISKN